MEEKKSISKTTIASYVFLALGTILWILKYTM